MAVNTGREECSWELFGRPGHRFRDRSNVHLIGSGGRNPRRRESSAEGCRAIINPTPTTANSGRTIDRGGFELHDAHRLPSEFHFACAPRRQHRRDDKEDRTASVRSTLGFAVAYGVPWDSDDLDRGNPE